MRRSSRVSSSGSPAKVPSYIADRDDLMNVGIIGLIAAIGKFDEKRNVQFETYARYRIRGAVLDELRARDWIPRSTRNKNAKLVEAYSVLQKELGRPPEDEEVSELPGHLAGDLLRNAR